MRSRPPNVPGFFYHVFTRGNALQALFRDVEDYETFETCVTRANTFYQSEIHAYCWMTNHVHLLLRAGAQPICQTVHHFSTQYARQFNRKYQAVGHVFQGRHGRRIIKSDEHLLQAVRYIHRNPLEAGIADDLPQYPWSSYPDYANGRQRGFVQTDFVLKLSGTSVDSARKALVDFTLGRELSKSTNPWKTWQEVMNEACFRFEITPEELCGSDTSRRCTEARCWVAKTAYTCELGSISWVARQLGRSRAALSNSLKAYQQRSDSKR